MGIFDVALLTAAIVATVPILLAALGELISERAGVINVGLEGMMLFGAFFAFLGTDQTGSLLLGAVIGAGAGLLLAALMALLSIQAGADQIVVGIGLNVLALGATGFLYETIFAGSGQVVLPTMGNWTIPGLSELPVVGETFFEAQPLTYLAILLIPAVWFLLYRSNWGLSIRAAGEMPEAVDAAGVDVRRVRWAATLSAGALAGLGGAALSIGQTGLFTEGMTAGRGFLALAAVIFGKWRLGGVVFASCLFGSADALQLRLQASSSVPSQVWVAIALGIAVLLAVTLLRKRPLGVRGSVGLGILCAGCVVLAITKPHLNLPSQLWLAFPYILTLLALAGFVGRAKLPRALALPYHRADADA
jgi:simple sugar transport system permease protein